MGEVQLAAHAVLSNFGYFYFVMPYGISVASGVRVGNLLGAQDPGRARFVSRTALTLCLGLVSCMSIVMYILQRQFARLYTADPRVLDALTNVVPIFFVHNSIDGLQWALQGSLRGSGQQLLIARVSLCSWYIAGLPMAALLCFGADLGLTGLWLGLACGPT